MAGDGTELELADWRRRVAGLYAAVLAAADPATAHALCARAGTRCSGGTRRAPCRPGPAPRPGLPYWPYDPGCGSGRGRAGARGARALAVPSGGRAPLLRTVGVVELPDADRAASLDLWWLDSTGADCSSRPGRDRGWGRPRGGQLRRRALPAGHRQGRRPRRTGRRIVVDLNFLYHPSCRYDARGSARSHRPGTASAPGSRRGSGWAEGGVSCSAPRRRCPPAAVPPMVSLGASGEMT